MKIRKSIRPISFKIGHYYVVKPITGVAMAETYLKERFDCCLPVGEIVEYLFVSWNNFKIE
jgi:hypothetical protein